MSWLVQTDLSQVILVTFSVFIRLPTVDSTSIRTPSRGTTSQTLGILPSRSGTKPPFMHRWRLTAKSLYAWL